MAGQDDGWETVTDPKEVPADIRKSIGVVGVRKAFGIGENDTPLPDGAAKRLEDQVGIYASLKRATGGFKDDYAGIGSSVENAVQGLTGLGTAGQRDWWANFRSTDNQIRNELFGAALSSGEQRAYEATTVTPSMAPSEIKANLERRESIIRDALSRRTAYLKANGYKPSAVDALLGEYGADFSGRRVNIDSALADAEREGGDPASSLPGAVATNGAPPPGPDDRGELTFNDQLPEQRSDAKEYTPEQRAQLVQIARTGTVADMRAAAASWGLTFPQSDEQLQGVLDTIKANPDAAVGVADVDNTVKPVDAGDGALGAAARGAGNALTFGGLDEVGALADVVTQGGTYDENLDRRRGQELFDEQKNGGSRILGQIVGGLPVGGLEFMGARAASAAAGRAAVRSGMSADAARGLANRVFAARTAAESAAIGGAYGFGDAEGGLAQRAGGAAIGAAAGGALGGGLALAGGRFARAMAARGGPRPTTEGQEVLAAMERQNVVPFAADVGGSPTRMATATAAQTLGGVGPIRQAAQATVDSAQAARDRIAQGIGRVVGVEETGEIARRGADAYRARTSAQVGRIYDAAEAAGGQTRVQTPEALRVLSQELPALEESPVQGAGVGILQGLREQLGGDVSVRGLRNARTVLREEFENNGLRGSNTERVANRVLDAASDDIVNGLRAQGQDRAASLYQRADRLWRERIETIDDNLSPILGDATGPNARSGEQIVKNLRAAMSGNNRRFVGFLNALPPEERNTVRASIVSRLGQATKGQQDETGEAFSLSTFLTNWNDIGETAKQRLFGAEGRSALNDLARIASSARQAQRFANTSNTGAAVTTSAIGTGAVLGGPAGIFGAATTIAAQYGAGRLLASPRFARWLTRAPQNPSAAPAYIARLTRVARAEPAIATDVLALQQRLADAFGGAPARLAADERRDRRDVIDRQDNQGASANQRLQP